MNAKKFSVALGNVRDEYVREAVAYQKKQKRYNWGKWATMAACLCLIVAGSLTVGKLLSWRSGIFYRTYSDTGIYVIEKIDFTTGNVTEILSVSGCHLEAQKIVGEKLYYYTTDNGGTISMLDFRTGESEVVYNLSVDDAEFYDDFVLMETEQGLSGMKYDDMQTVFISEYKPTTGALDYCNDKLYFQAAFETGVEEEYEEALVSIDLQTKEMNVVTQLTEGGMSKTYTEIAVCDDGYFYTEPSATEGGLFYHSFNGTAEITIRSNKR